MIPLVPYYKMALINIRTYLQWTLKCVRDSCRYRPLHVLSTLTMEQRSAAIRHICAALGESAVVDRTSRDWLKGSRKSNTSVEDRPRSGHPLTI